jgi:hypothetical protein
MESRVAENSANIESRVTEKSVNTENRIMQDSSGGKKLEGGKGAGPSKRPAPRWCPWDITKTQKHRLQKMHQRELAEKEEEEQQDYWFNRLRPMTKPKQTWQEKWLGKEEGGSSDNISGEEASKVTPTRVEDNSGSGDGNPESSNCNPKSGNCYPESGNRNSNSGNNNPMDVNMVFMIPTEFRAPTEDITELALGAGHLDGTLIERMLIDGGASINILSLSMLKNLGHVEGDLKHINLSLSGFAGDLTEAKGIICKEVMVGSKTVPTAFFVVDL